MLNDQHRIISKLFGWELAAKKTVKMANLQIYITRWTLLALFFVGSTVFVLPPSGKKEIFTDIHNSTAHWVSFMKYEQNECV